MIRFASAALLVSVALLLQGCLTTAVVGTAVGVTGAVVKTTAKAGGAVIGAAIPDGDDKKKK